MNISINIRASALIALCVPLLSSAVYAQETVQGWNPDERESMYYGTQGSRLIPKTWFDALEREDGSDFADIDNLTAFGLLAPPPDAPSLMPIGLVVDRQDDRSFSFSKLRWYAGQGGRDNTAEAWVGLNCTACHTGAYIHDGKLTIVDGAPSMFDFQSFIEALDKSLVDTQSDSAKWDRFSGKVLAGKNNEANQAKLKEAYASLVAWEKKTDLLNETKLRYGYGRLDAIGHIFNKILMFNGATSEQGNAANAPVSYPFLWNMWRQDKVQWNGSVTNSRVQIGLGSVEYGALGRNTGEVIGVFGDIKITPKAFLSGVKGYDSSVDVRNLMRMELLLKKLQSPVWPDSFPAIDVDMAQKGETLFRRNCADCHLTPDMQSKGNPTERMIPFINTPSINLTDIWMACNAYVYKGPTGPMEGTKDLNGDVLGTEAPVFNMLGVAVKGALLGSKGDLIKEVAGTIFGVKRLPTIAAADSIFDPRAGERATCLTTKDVPILAYKARPLDGIWATAPYLHNGSVASLYELLLPADDRMAKFWVGNREFDPVNVGYVNAEPSNGQAALISVRDSDGFPIEGNGNQGHEYGADRLNHDKRMALVEYLKSL